MAQVQPVPANNNGKATPAVPSKKPGPAKGQGPRPPLERTFGQAQDVSKHIQRLIARFRIWGTQAPTPQVKAKVETAAQDLTEALSRIGDVADLCHSLTVIGFRPTDSKPGTFGPGDQIEIRKIALAKWTALADKPADMDHLVVIRVVGSDVVVGVLDETTGNHHRFGVVPRGALAPKKGGAQ